LKVETPVTVRWIMMEWHRLQAEQKELVTSLKQIRGGKKDWEEGIKEDKRTPVKLLWAELEKIKNEISDFDCMKFVEYEEEEDELI